MTSRWNVALVVVVGMTSAHAAGPTIAIDATAPAGKVSPLFYGLMTEEINHSYDGGLYAELVRNRAFLDDARSPAHWSVVQSDGSTAAIALDRASPSTRRSRTSLRLDVTQASTGHAAGVANEGYWGIPVKPHTRYRASFYAKAAQGSAVRSRVSIQSEDGPDGLRAAPRSPSLTQAWKRYEGDAADRRASPPPRRRATPSRWIGRARCGSAWCRCFRRRSRISRTASGPTSCRCSWT